VDSLWLWRGGDRLAAAIRLDLTIDILSSNEFHLGEFRRRPVRRLISGVLLFAGDILRVGIMRKTFGDPWIAPFEFPWSPPRNWPGGAAPGLFFVEGIEPFPFRLNRNGGSSFMF
jgi:hypothetical protein